MNCPGSEQIAAYVDGRLNASEEALLLEHCADCDECRREMVLLKRVVQEPPGGMPVGLVGRTIKSLPRPSDRVSRHGTRRWARQPSYGPLAAAVLVLGIAGLLLAVYLRQPPEHLRPAVAARPPAESETPPPAPEPVVEVPAEVLEPVPEPPAEPEPPAPPPVPPRVVVTPENPGAEPGPMPVAPEPEPVRPPAETVVEAAPEPVRHVAASRAFSELQLTDFTGTLSVRRKGRTETLAGVARLDEDDVITSRGAAAFRIDGRDPVVLLGNARVSLAYVEAEQAPYLRLHEGEALVESTGPTRWIVSDGKVAVVVKQARARFSASPRRGRLAVAALSEPIYVQPDGGKVHPVSPGEELRVSADGTERSPFEAEAAGKLSSAFEKARPRDRTLFYTSCDPVDARRDHFFLETGSYWRKEMFVSRTEADRSASVVVRPNPRIHWRPGLVVRFRVRTNAQRIRVELPVAEKRFSRVTSISVPRRSLNRWVQAELGVDGFSWRADDGVPLYIRTSDKFDSLRFTAQQQDVFGDQKVLFLLDDVQVVQAE